MKNRVLGRIRRILEMGPTICAILYEGVGGTLEHHAARCFSAHLPEAGGAETERLRRVKIDVDPDS